MAGDTRLVSARFPRASAYHPDWVLGGVSGGANPLWLAEWLSEAVAADLKPGARVLDLGCGRALSSVFFRREFGVQVWAVDLWFDPAENLRRARDACVGDGVFPLRADARALPFSPGFFDAVVSVDSFFYYGTDDLYLNDLARFVAPGGVIAIACAGLTRELEGDVPAHLRAWWDQDRPYFLHAADWWRRHWSRTGLVDVEIADTLDGGHRLWRDWLALIAPDNALELDALDADRGQTLGYVRAAARLRPDARPQAPITSIPTEYTPHPLLRPAD